MADSGQKNNRSLPLSWLAKAKKRLSEYLAPVLLSLPVVVRFALLNIAAIGNDTMIHIYKGYVLIQQMSHLPPFLWGLWDWSWRAGYPFLQTYAPVFYYILASLSLLFQLAPEMGAKIVLLLSFPISALSMYLLASYLSKNRIASLVATAGYLYNPYHIVNLSITGSSGSVLAFMFMPLALLFAERNMNTGRKRYSMLSAIFLTLTLLSNHLFGLVSITLVFFWMIFKRRIVQPLLVIFMTVSLSAFWLFPYLLTIKSNPPVTFERNIIKGVYEIVRPGNELIGFFAFSIIFITVVMWFVRSRRLTESLRDLADIKKTFIVCSTILIGIAVYNLIGFFFTVAPLDLLLFSRTMPAVSLLFPLILMFPLFLVKKRNLVALVIVSLLIVDSLFVPTYYPISPSRYTKAFQFLKNDSKWSRVLFVPREPVGTLIPLYTGKPVIDGWADHELDAGKLIHDIADYTEYGVGGRREPDLIKNTEKALSSLKYLGVKYVVVDASDPIPGNDLSLRFFEALNSSRITRRVFSSDLVSVFEIQNFKPIIATTKISIIKDLDEFYQSIGNISNHAQIFFYEWQVPNGLQESQDENQVDLIDFQILERTEKFEVTINARAPTARPFYLLIPVTNMPDLSVRVDDREVTPFTAVPGFAIVELQGAGVHNVSVSVKLKLENVVGILVSLIAIPLFLIGVLISRRIRVRGKRRMMV